MTDLDLFGLAAGPMLTEKQRRRLKNKSPMARGYAAIPGTGPKGETCKTCEHYVLRQYGGKYRKCGLMRRFWTKGSGTDIKAGSPACRNWEKAKEKAK